MSLLDYWPDERSCLDCIKPEAENPSDAVFLAVHQPMTLLRTSFTTDQKEVRTEGQLLSELLKDDPSGRVIMPILGDSGVGKSHLVRWIDVQLRRLKDTASRHVIRIPKSSSLKSVLYRILEGLSGPRYEEIRRQLQAARDQLDDIAARQRVRAELLATIERKYVAAKERKSHVLTNGGTLSHEEELWLGHGDDKSLRAILSDPATEKMFFEGTKERPGILGELAAHLTTDRHVTRPNFEAEDFVVPPELSKVIDKDASPIAKRYLARLNRTSDKDRNDALYLLNRIVDDAIAPLATPADTSLAEIFYEIRRQLLEEGRELVLLVEDFAVLAGIQRSLLDAMIREAESGGKRQACVIRTVLAVTEGYFKELDTVRTRAVYGWRIETVPSDEESATFSRIATFVAAYLNAARMGVERLQRHYESSQGEKYERPDAKRVLSLEDDEVARLRSFGESDNGIALFPFNATAIAELADKRMRTENGKLRFHPRSIINDLILPVVKNHRGDFERGEFPPVDFLGFTESAVSIDLATDLEARESDPNRRKRLLYLLRFWGGNPRRLSEVSLSPDVFRAFQLPTHVSKGSNGIKPATATTTTTNRPGASPPPPPVAPPPPDDREPAEIAKLIDALHSWREGSILPQGDALKVRKTVASFLTNSLDWESLLLREPKGLEAQISKAVYLANARGQEANVGDCVTCVISDKSYQTPEVRNKVVGTLRAIVRFEHYKGWDYEGGEIDYVWCANFASEHRHAVASWIRGRYHGILGDPVAALVQTLLWQARILNIPDAHSAELASLVSATICQDVPPATQDDNEDWRDFMNECRVARPILIEQLYERITAWQGTGRIPYAIDASAVLDSIRELKQSWRITATLPKLMTTPEDTLRTAHEHMRKLISKGTALVSDRRAVVLQRSREILKQFGESFDQAEVLNILKQVIELCAKHGVSGSTTANAVSKQIERFQNARTAEVLQQVRLIEQDSQGGPLMSAIARLDVQAHSVLVDFATTCSTFLAERVATLQAELETWTDSVLIAKTKEVDRILEGLEITAKRFVEK